MLLQVKIGILKRTTEAKKNSDNASDLEYLQVEATAELMDYYQGNDGKNEDEYILEKWSSGSNSKIAVNKTDKTVTYNGKTYAMSDIIGNESEKSKINESNMKQITISTATKEEDKEILSSGKVRVIIEEDNNMRAYIPNGFYYVTGKPSNGMVISDIYGDDDNNTKGGNQFVWVPCSVDKNATDATDNGTTVTYEKVNGLAKTWREKYTGPIESGWQWYYTKVPEDKKDDENAGKKITDWKDAGGNEDSVKKYNGFYIARYEAGLPENSDLWAKKDGAKYGWTNGEAAGSFNGTRDTTSMIPVSKKNNASWNRISQKNALVVSKKMYEGSQTVTSSLVDSYAWDTILVWYEKAAKASGTTIKCINSTSYGNYLNTKMSLKDALYAVHVYHDGTSTSTNVTDDKSGWKSYASKYTLGSIDILSRSVVAGMDRILYEIATGSTDYAKVNNIYDMAGNMWEWTTEVGDHSVTNSDQDKTTGKYAVRRGGSFDGYGNDYPVSDRHGNSDASWYDFSIGFRVALYIK